MIKGGRIETVGLQVENDFVPIGITMVDRLVSMDLLIGFDVVDRHKLSFYFSANPAVIEFGSIKTTTRLIKNPYSEPNVLIVPSINLG